MYVLVGTPDLLNDAQTQVVVGGDPADAVFAVDAQQGAVLGPVVAVACGVIVVITPQRDRRILR